VLGLVRYHVPFVIDIGSRMVEVVGLVRDPLYTKEFRQMLRGAGLKPLLLAARSPNLNAYAERLVLSIKSECLDRIVPLGERHLRRAIVEYLAHCHGERNHQGLGNVLFTGLTEPANENGRVQRRERLGGLLNFYHRTAA